MDTGGTADVVGYKERFNVKTTTDCETREKTKQPQYAILHLVPGTRQASTAVQQQYVDTYLVMCTAAVLSLIHI